MPGKVTKDGLIEMSEAEFSRLNGDSKAISDMKAEYKGCDDEDSRRKKWASVSGSRNPPAYVLYSHMHMCFVLYILPTTAGRTEDGRQVRIRMARSEFCFLLPILLSISTVYSDK